MVVDHIQKSFVEKDIALAYVYCDWQDSVAQTPSKLIGSLLRQLVERQPSLPTSVSDLYIKSKYGRAPLSLEESIGILRELAATVRRLFVLVDAVDECGIDIKSGESGALVLENALKSLLEDGTMSTNLSVFTTSRFDQQTSDEEGRFTRIELYASKADLQMFIESEFTNPQLTSPWTNQALARMIQQDLALRDEVVACCLEHAGEMFLLARLHVSHLKRQINYRQLQRAMKDLSANLSDTIDGAIFRIQNQEHMQRELGIAVVVWVANALRPMRMKELQQALAVEDGDFEYAEEGETPGSLLIASCAGLVTLDSNTGIVRLINFSVKEYLGNAQQEWFTGSHLKIARTCMTFLSFRTFSNVREPDRDAVNQLLDAHPFLAYAATHWGTHARSAPENSCLDQSIRLLSDEARVNLMFRVLYVIALKTLESCPLYITGLHLAAYFDLSETMISLIKSGASVDASDTFGRTALYMAAARGHAESAKVLVDSKAAVTGRTTLKKQSLRFREPLKWWFPPWSRDDRSGCALEAAAEAGYRNLVVLLIEAGAGINSGSGLHGCPLEAAAHRAHPTVVQELLARRASINRTTLQAAIYGGNAEILQHLLERASKETARESRWSLSNRKNWNRATLQDFPFALYAAALANRVSCVRKLLQYAINVNEETKGFYLTALQAAASQGNIEIMQLLIDAGADVNAATREFINRKDKDAHRKLFGLCSYESQSFYSHDKKEPNIEGYIPSEDQKSVYEVPEALHGNKNRFDYWQMDHHGTALQAAAYANQVDAFHLLLAHGADVNAYAGHFGTALQAAAASGSQSLVAELLQQGAHVNTLTGFYGNPLQAAAAGGYPLIVELLLDAGAAVNARGGEYSYPLQAAARSGNLQVTEILINSGADLNAKGGPFGSALQAAIMGAPKEALKRVTAEFVDSILEVSPDYELVLNADRNVIRNMIRFGVFGRLLRESAGGSFGVEEEGYIWDVEESESRFLQALSQNDNYDVFKLLLDRGADPNVRGGYYDTLLLASAATGRARILNLLLQLGADPNEETQGDGESYYYADIVDTPLGKAILHGHFEATKLLLEAGVDPNTTASGNSKETPLHLAARREDNNPQVVRLLISKGANVNAVDDSQLTPLQIAVGNSGTRYRNRMSGGSLTIVQLLLEMGADVNAKSGDSYVLEFVDHTKDPEITSSLLKAGACQESVYRALRKALAMKYLQMKYIKNWKAHIKLLLEAGADVNAGKIENPNNHWGHPELINPLVLIADAGPNDDEVVEMLSKAGADISKLGTYPLQRAVERSHNKVVQALLGYGACPSTAVIEQAMQDLHSKETKDYSYRQLSGTAEMRANEFAQLVKRRQEILDMLHACPIRNCPPAADIEITVDEDIKSTQ
jgi:ankyrin repeat protein